MFSKSKINGSTSGQGAAVDKRRLDPKDDPGPSSSAAEVFDSNEPFSFLFEKLTTVEKDMTESPVAADEKTFEDKPQTAEVEVDSNISLKLKVVGHLGQDMKDVNEIHFQVKRTTQMGKLKKIYSERVGVSLTSLHFHFDGGRLNDDQTPEALEMEQDDVIEVYEEQIDFMNRKLREEYWPVQLDDKDAFSKPEVIDLTSRRRAIGKRRICFSEKSVQPKNDPIPTSLATEVFNAFPDRRRAVGKRRVVLSAENVQSFPSAAEVSYSNQPVEKLATNVTESTLTANKVDQKTCEDRSQAAEEEVDSKILPVVDPKEICWFCHTSRSDLPVLYKCAGCNPKVIF